MSRGAVTPDCRFDTVNAPVSVALDVVLPDADDKPPLPPKPPEVPVVTAAVVLDLLPPVHRELLPPCREAPTVPVVAVHEHRHSAAYEDEVRAPGEASVVLPETQSASVSEAPDHQLRSRIRASNPRHHVAPLRGREIVDHESPELESYCASAAGRTVQMAVVSRSGRISADSPPSSTRRAFTTRTRSPTCGGGEASAQAQASGTC